MQDQGFISTVTRGTRSGPDEVYTPTTQENISKRRLWLGLKYYDNEPVLSRMQLVSTPKKRINLSLGHLKKVVAGKDTIEVRALQPGEALFLLTDKGTMEARQAIELQIGGQCVCRVS